MGCFFEVCDFLCLLGCREVIHDTWVWSFSLQFLPNCKNSIGFDATFWLLQKRQLIKFGLKTLWTLSDIHPICQIRQTEIPIHLVWTSEKETVKIKRTKLPFKFCINLTSKWKSNFICNSLKKLLQNGKEFSQICLNIQQAQICHLI